MLVKCKIDYSALWLNDTSYGKLSEKSEYKVPFWEHDGKTFNPLHRPWALKLPTPKISKIKSFTSGMSSKLTMAIPPDSTIGSLSS